MEPEVPPLPKERKTESRRSQSKEGETRPAGRLAVSEAEGRVGFAESSPSGFLRTVRPFRAPCLLTLPRPPPARRRGPRGRRGSAEGGAGRAAAALGLPGPERCPALLGARLRGPAFSAGPGACATPDVEDSLSVNSKKGSSESRAAGSHEPSSDTKREAEQPSVVVGQFGNKSRKRPGCLKSPRRTVFITVATQRKNC